MNWPGFTAEAAIDATRKRSYLTRKQRRRTSNRIALADSCTCTDPGCENPTCSCACPPPPPPCEVECRGKLGCAKSRCICTCNGGFIMNNPHFPCGFRCFLQ